MKKGKGILKEIRVMLKQRANNCSHAWRGLNDDVPFEKACKPMFHSVCQNCRLLK